MSTLASRLISRPPELRFGTSGQRGLVADLTQLEIYTNVVGELEYLQSLAPRDGGIVRGDEFYFAYDLRPSSTEFVAGESVRGEICQAVARAIEDTGMRAVNLGAIPTPALAYYAFSRARGSIMVTGSHIPFDRNGYKLNTSCGELLKEHEAPINQSVRRVRERLESAVFEESIFDAAGMFRDGHRELAPASDDARAAYVRRYETFFEGCSLAGQRIVVYQHSAVGRDLLVELLRHFGAKAIPAGRSSTFVPIDTENIGAGQLAAIQALVDEAASQAGSKVDAVVSLDGDSDRPLVLGIEPGSGRARFFGGDLVGMITAQYLGADSVVVPISCNDGIDRGELRHVVEPKTRIGSPYVIQGIERAREKGRTAVCGWEANGGFLTGSAMARGGGVLEPLATRDAVLPLLCVLFASAEKGVPVVELFRALPARYSKAALLKEFPRAISARLVQCNSPEDAAIRDAQLADSGARAFDEEGRSVELSEAAARQIEAIRQNLERFFSVLGAGRIVRLNYTDGVRMEFANGEIAHFRPSGNADEFRIYAVADSQERAEWIAELATVDEGILRKMAGAAGVGA